MPQFYLTNAPNERRMRLLGFERVALEPGEAVHVTITTDPRLLARFDGKKQHRRIDDGTYSVALARSAGEPVQPREAKLGSRYFGR